jgi:predicted nucleic acid-binding protein
MNRWAIVNRPLRGLIQLIARAIIDDMDFLTAKHLFIDTNVLLSFYHYSGDDLEELKKLIVLLDQKKIKLYVPAQVKSEFNRNREVKIADALKRLIDQRLSLQFPQICKDYPEFEAMRRLQYGYEREHSLLLNKLKGDVANHKLKADEIISNIFSFAMTIESDDLIVARARLRYDLGNPPGKKGSLGDAVNWEALLSAVPSGKDLYFITDDKDFSSPLNEDDFNGFLAAEWSKEKRSDVIFYKRISAFFKEHFPAIKLAVEFEKDLLISDLTESSSFSRTHSVIAKLSRFTDFTADQLNSIVSGAVSNSQVRSIIDDSYVRDFLTTVLKGHKGLIDQENLEMLEFLLSPDSKGLDCANTPF